MTFQILMFRLKTTKKSSKSKFVFKVLGIKRMTFPASPSIFLFFATLLAPFCSKKHTEGGGVSNMPPPPPMKMLKKSIKMYPPEIVL